MKPVDVRLSMAVYAGMCGWDIGRNSFDKPEVKCRLKDCQRMTTHNGGYCSAEHCTMDRKLRRKSK